MRWWIGRAKYSASTVEGMVVIARIQIEKSVSRSIDTMIPHTPIVPDEAMSRESIYDDRI